MRARLLRSGVMLGVLAGMCLPLTSCPESTEIVLFRELKLENAVKAKLGAPFGFLSKGDLLRLYELDARDLGIEDLSGLEHCRNLSFLDASGNNITDLTPIKDLVNLRDLHLADNNIKNIDALEGLFFLENITLTGNDIWNLKPLQANASNQGIGPGTTVRVDAGMFLSDDGTFLSADQEEIVTGSDGLNQSGVEVIFDPGA